MKALNFIKTLTGFELGWNTPTRRGTTLSFTSLTQRPTLSKLGITHFCAESDNFSMFVLLATCILWIWVWVATQLH